MMNLRNIPAYVYGIIAAIISPACFWNTHNMFFYILLCGIYIAFNGNRYKESLLAYGVLVGLFTLYFSNGHNSTCVGFLTNNYSFLALSLLVLSLFLIRKPKLNRTASSYFELFCFSLLCMNIADMLQYTGLSKDAISRNYPLLFKPIIVMYALIIAKIAYFFVFIYLLANTFFGAIWRGTSTSYKMRKLLEFLFIASFPILVLLSAIYFGTGGNLIGIPLASFETVCLIYAIYTVRFPKSGE